jgi:predicted kinase
MGQHRLIGKSCTQHSKDLGRVPVAVEQQVGTKGIDRARKRLARARATLFDSELFQEVSRYVTTQLAKRHKINMYTFCI